MLFAVVSVRSWGAALGLALLTLCSVSARSQGAIHQSTTGDEPAAAWLADLSAAQAQARASNRPLLVVFSGSDWCKPCIMFEKEVFAQSEFAAFAKDRLVLAHFDFPRLKKNQPSATQLKLNETAAAQLNPAGDFPLAVVLSPEGKVLAKTGYIPGGPAAFAAYLKQVVPGLP